MLTGWRTCMSRAARPKGVRAYACLRFPTSGRRSSDAPQWRIAGWTRPTVERDRLTMLPDHISLFDEFAQAFNRELGELGSDVRIAAAGTDCPPGSMEVLGHGGVRLGYLPMTIEPSELIAFMHLLADAPEIDRSRVMGYQNSYTRLGSPCPVAANTQDPSKGPPDGAGRNGVLD